MEIIKQPIPNCAYNSSGKVPCITATYSNGYDGFGTRPYILENGE